jgi:hypothetical protein
VGFPPCGVSAVPVMVAVGSSGLLPPGFLDASATAWSALLAAALFSRRLARPALAGVTGRRAAAVGLASWVLVEGTSLVGLHLVT